MHWDTKKTHWICFIVTFALLQCSRLEPNSQYLQGTPVFVHQKQTRCHMLVISQFIESVILGVVYYTAIDHWKTYLLHYFFSH